MQNLVALIDTYLPILHLEMEFSIYLHLQGPKIRMKIAPLGFRRTCKRHKPQPLTTTFPYCKITHQSLKSSSLLLCVSSVWYGSPQVEIELFPFTILGCKISLIRRVILIEHRPKIKKLLDSHNKKGKDAGYLHSRRVTANTPAISTNYVLASTR